MMQPVTPAAGSPGRQVPAAHSPPAVQVVSSGWLTQPPAWQASAVQATPSSHDSGVPPHWPSWQVSLVVQASPSSQVAPVAGTTPQRPPSHTSAVQGSPSSSQSSSSTQDEHPGTTRFWQKLEMQGSTVHGS